MTFAREPHETIGACYDAVFEPGNWPGALQGLADSLGANSCALRCCDASHPLAPDQRGKPLSPADSTEHAAFSALWLERVDGAPDPHNDRPRRLRKRPMDFSVEDEITTEDERRTLPYYNEIARPGRRDWWAAIKFPANRRSWCIALFRDARRGRFDPREARRFIALAPDLSRIVRTAEALGNIASAPAVDVLNHTGLAAVLLDHRGLVSKANEHAEAILGADLVIRHGHVRARDAASDARLQALVAGALSSRIGDSSPLAPVVVSREGIPQLLAEAMPMTAIGHDLFGGGHVLLYFINLGAERIPDKLCLRSAFSLTPAEARLAARLAGGTGIEAACEELAIGRETARTQLKSIFAKTGTHRQAELSALLSRFGGDPRRSGS